MRPIIGITMGDAAGIGPEIILKSIENESVFKKCTPVVIGDRSILERDIVNFGLNLELNTIKHISDAVESNSIVNIFDSNLLQNNLEYGSVSMEAGDAAFKYLEKAVELYQTNEIDAICTAPLNKEALHLGGHKYPGHTEILAELTNTKNYSMMLSCPEFKVIHLTTHMGLIDAVNSITSTRTYNVIKLAYDTLKTTQISGPKIAVCGVNPHAGENGLFGQNEEEEILGPGIEKARREGIDVEGPYAADTLFYRAKKGDFDVIVACYHDQGHIPVKLFGLESGVNITVGLKGGLIRTSVDHGTAFDIAGKNIADSRSMVEAIRVAIELLPNK